MATSHKVLPSMFAQYKQFRFFRNIPSTSVANVALAFKSLQSSAILMVQDLSYHEIAITPLQHVRGRIKMATYNARRKTLLRCYVGRAGDEAVVEQTEEELVQLVLEDLRKTMDITEDPEFTIVSRWKEAMPQYTVGHNERMKKLTTFMEKELPGIYLAGSSYAGAGLPDCMNQGEEAAKRVLFHLEKVIDAELIAQ